MRQAPPFRWRRLLEAAVVTGSALCLLAYALSAAELARYPFDWSPDEGLFLDYARRLIHSPETLYGHTAVPFPASHGPLLPVLLVPVVASFREPLGPARLLALAWTAAIAACVYVLVRRRAGAPLALACAALALAPVDLTCWYMLVRVDGLMTALWLLGAVVLMPKRLERGADRLSGARITTGCALVLAAALTKPTAVVYAAPLVLGWWWVDRDGAGRLTAVLLTAGIALLMALQALTSGGFLWVMRLWSLHPRDLQMMRTNVAIYAEATGLVLLIAALGLLANLRADGRPWRDGALLLCLGGVMILPAMSKSGAWWNYLLPLLCATVVLGGRLWAAGPAPVQALGAVCTASLAVWLTLSRTFPLPNPEDKATGRAFYTFIAEVVRAHGGPILAMRPDYAYYVAGQPAEAEASSFGHLVRARAPGTERVQRRLESRTYTLVVAPALLGKALAQNYRWIGRCSLEFFSGPITFSFFVPQGSRIQFTPPPGARCHAFSRPSNS